MTDKPIHIIAEAGTTHEGNVDTALQLLDIAKNSGADSVKYQFINSPGLYLTKIRKNGELIDNPVVAIRDSQALSDNEWQRVAKRSGELNLPFTASVFDPEGLDFLMTLNPPYLKLASTDTTNLPLIEAACSKGKTVLLSTGMSGLGEIEDAVEAIVKVGAKDVVLLHCVSAYPCPTDITNMGFIRTLQESFGLPVGFSDHTENSIASILAVSMGVTWIEKHFTYDRSAEGFDHAYAMEPDMLRDFVSDVRQAEAAMKRQLPKVGEKEASVRVNARRGLWSARDLPAGHVLTAEDVLAVRPEGPLTPANLHNVIGRKLIKPLSSSMAFRPEDLE